MAVSLRPTEAGPGVDVRGVPGGDVEYGELAVELRRATQTARYVCTNGVRHFTRRRRIAAELKTCIWPLISSPLTFVAPRIRPFVCLKVN